MELNPSDILSVAALLTAGLSAYYARGQRDLAQAANNTTYRAQLAERHEKYRVALKEVNDRHKEELAELSRLATTTLIKVIDIFDDFDVEEPRPRYLRHILHESSEMVYHAFKGQLGWQSGLNIAHRMHRFIHAEHDLQPSRRYFEQDCSQEVFVQAYFANPNEYLEQGLFKDKHFCSLVRDLKRRAAPANGAELLRRVLSELEDFACLLKMGQPGFEKSADYLDEMLEEGKRDHFKLHESPDLFNRLEYRHATLETISCLVIPSVRKEDAGRYREFVSVCIYICAVLHAVQGFDSWGWTEYRPE